MATTVTLADIVLSGATNLNDTAGWQTAEKKVEQGFDFESYVAPEPIEETIEAWVSRDDIGDLRDLRDQAEPFKASIGSVSFAKASLQSLDITEEGRPDKLKVNIKIKEITQATLESAEINIETESGSMGTAASETDSSTAQPDDSDGGSVEDETGGVVESLAGVRKSLAGVL